MNDIITKAFAELDGATFANARAYRDELARMLGTDYDADAIAAICGGFDIDSYDAATKRCTVYRQHVDLEHFAATCDSYGPIDANSFYVSTVADFMSVPGHPARPADYESESGSRYWYSDKGVIRESNHWGRGVASCDWYLDGDEYGWSYRDAPACGFCAWGDFKRK